MMKHNTIYKGNTPWQIFNCTNDRWKIHKNQIIKLINFNDSNVGYDVKNEVIGDMYKMGVIDPLKVTKNALINAVSVATTILSTNAIVTHARAIWI